MAHTVENADVEIKVTVSGEATEAACETLELDPDEGKHRTIHFWDSPRHVNGGVELPLLDDGLVIRLRKAKKSDKDDLTVKLRPCDRDRLPAGWQTPQEQGEWEFTIEEDWTGRTRVWAASLKADGDYRRPTADDEQSNQPELTDEQRDLLDRSGFGSDRLKDLLALGPIDSVQWKPSLRDLIHPVTAELWSVGDEGLRFLELSIRTGPAEASATQALLTRTLRERGLHVSDRQESKTRAAMTALARAGGVSR
ncbi:hypothetical protein [Kitasatospora sp. NPDC057015]|uniref:hypothetical protein n=1 Tax=Kitasatospora sp. NPDC057015 TaxID=3346001 RepID=UPI00362F4F95